MDGVFRTRVHRRERSAAVRRVCFDVDEDDVGLADELVGMCFPAVLAVGSATSWWKEVIRRQGQGAENRSIQGVGLSGGVQLEGGTRGQREGDGPVVHHDG